MAWRFDHLGVIVPDLARGRAHLAAAFGVVAWSAAFEDPLQSVCVQFGRDASGFCYEAISPLGAQSPVAPALRAGTRILNHVAYLVADLDAAATHLSSLDYASAGPPRPAVAYCGARVQFFASPLRFLTELIEAPDWRHDFVGDRSPAG